MSIVLFTVAIAFVSFACVFLDTLKREKYYDRKEYDQRFMNHKRNKLLWALT